MLTKTEADAAYIHELETQNAKLRAELEAAQKQVDLLRTQAVRNGISMCELVAQKQHAERQLSDALNENANLKDENAALKRGEAGELLTKAQKDGAEWKEMFDRVSTTFRDYREEVESGELYKAQRRVIHALIDERNELVTAKKVADAAVAYYDSWGSIKDMSELSRALCSAAGEYRALTESPLPETGANAN